MRYFTWCASLLGIALLLTIAAAPAQAQTRTWVSGVGDDVNPCSRTAPCKTFAGAYGQTAAGGEINCIDSGGFGGLTITKSITIICDTGTAGVLVAGTNGITINVASTDSVLLQGLDIEGSGSGLDGISIVGAGAITIIKCSIRHFTGNGVGVVGLSGARATIDDSVIVKNAVGVNVAGISGATNIGFIRNSIIDANSTYSTSTAGGSSLVLIGSILSGTAVAINAAVGANVFSYGNNVFRGTGLPTQTLALQ